MEYVLGGLWSALDVLGCYLFSRAFLPLKTNRKSILIVLFIVLIACIYPNIVTNQYIKLFLTVTVYMLLSVLLLQGTIAVHACLAVVYYIFNAAMDTVAIHGMCYLLNISYNTFVWRKLAYMTLVTADKLLVVFLAWILHRFRKKGNLGKLQNKWVLLSSLFPTVSTVMLAVLFYTSPRDGDVSLSVVIFAVILMIANIAMIYVICSVEKTTEQEQDLRLLRQQISIQTENYKALKKNYGIQRKSTHEFERHIQVLCDLLDRLDHQYGDHRRSSSLRTKYHH